MDDQTLKKLNLKFVKKGLTLLKKYSTLEFKIYMARGFK
jgi:hypothetical protein